MPVDYRCLSLNFDVWGLCPVLAFPFNSVGCDAKSKVLHKVLLTHQQYIKWSCWGLFEFYHNGPPNRTGTQTPASILIFKLVALQTRLTTKSRHDKNKKITKDTLQNKYFKQELTKWLIDSQNGIVGYIWRSTKWKTNLLALAAWCCYFCMCFNHMQKSDFCLMSFSIGFLSHVISLALCLYALCTIVKSHINNNPKSLYYTNVTACHCS